MDNGELKGRYGTAIAQIVAQALPNERPRVETGTARIFGAPEGSLNLQFAVWLESDSAEFGLVSGEDWIGKLERLVIGAEELATSEPMQAKLADALAALPPDYPRLGRVVEFIRDELIAIGPGANPAPNDQPA